MIPGSLWDIPDFSLMKHAVNDANGRATNNFGFREKDVVVPKPAGLVRIICVGGSTTDEGSSNDITYPAILERKLNASFNGNPPIEVLNCGIPALYSARERARMLDYLEMEPDCIIYYHGVNHFLTVMMPQWPDMVSLWQKILPGVPIPKSLPESLAASIRRENTGNDTGNVHPKLAGNDRHRGGPSC